MFPEGKSGAETAEDFSTPGTPPDNPLTMSTEVGCPSTVGCGRIPQTHTSPNKNYLGGEDYQDSALDPSRQGSYEDGQWEDAEATYMDIKDPINRSGEANLHMDHGEYASYHTRHRQPPDSGNGCETIPNACIPSGHTAPASHAPKDQTPESTT